MRLKAQGEAVQAETQEGLERAATCGAIGLMYIVCLVKVVDLAEVELVEAAYLVRGGVPAVEVKIYRTKGTAPV